jgi:type 2 lantibiotic biosynthesis protein LanM
MNISPYLNDNNQKILENTWYHALTLNERIPVLNFLDNDEILQQRPTQRLEQWKKQAAFRDQEEVFAERLALDNLTEQDLLMLLAEPVEHLQRRIAASSVPAWVSELTAALLPNASENTPLPSPEPENGHRTIMLLDIFKPLIAESKSTLRQEILQLADMHCPLPFDPITVFNLLLANLAPRLQDATIRALVLEMHIARMEQRLSGNTSEERFANFLQQLCQPEQLRSFLGEYPVMARVVVTIIQHWTNQSIELLQRLCTDWAEICETFAQEADPGILTSIQGGAGDTHCEGRSVALLHFSSGLQLVYKPRPLSLDQHFQEILTWINARGKVLPLRTLILLNKGAYGWTEFVQEYSCISEEEIARFYERQGSYLALLYALNASDFHYENIIAAGEHPVPVDLEALFHPRMNIHNKVVIDRQATQSINYSVQRIGLLPQRFHIEGGGEGIDISGLGGKKGQLTPWTLPVWKEGRTDQMHIAQEQREIMEKKNRPKLHGEDIDVLRYEPYILKGFTEMYQLLIENREDVLTQLLPGFENDEVRVILRHTRTYATLLRESFHPERLGDALEQEKLFDYLWSGVQQQPYLRRIIATERRDLQQGDIPLFTTQPTSRDLFTSRGERIVDFCAEPGMEFVKRRVQQMNSKDLAMQQWIIKASLATTQMDARQMRQIPSQTLSPSEVTHEQLISAACAVGDRLEELMLRSEQGGSWLGIAIATENQGHTVWHVQEADLNLYDGLPGIILFLSYLGALTGHAKYTHLAQTALLTVQDQLDKQDQGNTFYTIGAFMGTGSLIYLFSHLSALWHDPSYLSKAEKLLNQLDQRIEQDQQFDIITGSAGCIASLLSFYHVARSPQILAMAVRCGDHLLAHAQPMEKGAGWYTLGEYAALAGFSHGGAGIALSLFRLAGISQQDRFYQTAQAAIDYERSLFSQEQRNWARLLPQDKPEFPVTWCHGAAGIGLARLAALKYRDDEQMRQEISVALATTITGGFGYNQSLCHGDLGNLETLLTATEVLTEPRYDSELKRLTALVFNSIQKHGWVTGVPMGLETPGLMTGLAGIGYQLLRLAEPMCIPSVLSLAPPHINR